MVLSVDLQHPVHIFIRCSSKNLVDLPSFSSLVKFLIRIVFLVLAVVDLLGVGCFSQFHIHIWNLIFIS